MLTMEVRSIQPPGPASAPACPNTRLPLIRQARQLKRCFSDRAFSSDIVNPPPPKPAAFSKMGGAPRTRQGQTALYHRGVCGSNYGQHDSPLLDKSDQVISAPRATVSLSRPHHRDRRVQLLAETIGAPTAGLTQHLEGEIHGFEVGVLRVTAATFALDYLCKI